ncbi:MAG TPA: pseudaminic acid synthase [Lacunisphaera sp.]
MNTPFTIKGRAIGPGHPVYVIAEMSANHNQDFAQAAAIVQAAKNAGADAIKLQTYTPDTMTLDLRTPVFQIGRGTIWEGRNLHELYGEAFTPWDWQPRLKQLAEELGLHCFSTPFDFTAVDFLERMEVPAHKIASFELVDLPLIRRVAETGKPVIMSTGMASLAEIDEAVRAFRAAGGTQLALLKCTSAYPSPAAEMHLRTIPHLAEAFGVPSGLSDHTLGTAVPVAAVALGACIIEKHFTLSRTEPGPDSAFSLEPAEFKAMVDAIRTTEQALGAVSYHMSTKEEASRVFRRSLFIVQDVKAGELLTETNVRSIRPGYGLPPKHWDNVVGRRAACDIARGTPLDWKLIAGAAA